MNFESIGLHVPTVLLPRPEVDLTKWSVVACDQYTSQAQYWSGVRRLIGDSPSTLRLIFPEVFLESDARPDMIRAIHDTMKQYLNDAVLLPQKPGFILVDRKTSHASSRKGLIVALDLEHYDYSEHSRSLIRPTEGTILDRLPPRVQVRENAPIEAPHVMVLIDDPSRTVIEPLFEKGCEKLYDFSLMMQGGHIQGYRIDDEKMLGDVAQNLSRLADPGCFSRKYNVTGKAVLLYAMGDGNHSFATAKVIWEKLKASAQDKQAIMNHPARYALVELVNVHDEGLQFEPIHRVVFDVDVKDMLKSMKHFFGERGSAFSCTTDSTRDVLEQEQMRHARDNVHCVLFVWEEGFGLLSIRNPERTLETATLQSFLDWYLTKSRHAKIDYIHGEKVVGSLGAAPGNVGFYLPVLSKNDLFKTIILDGALPRKAFSMGAADEKRFYVECRKIVR